MSTIKLYLASQSDNTDNVKTLARDITPSLGGVTVLPALFGTFVSDHDGSINIFEDTYSYLIIAETHCEDVYTAVKPHVARYLKSESQYAALLCVNSDDPRLISQDDIL